MSGKELCALQRGQCMIVLHVTSSKVAYRMAQVCLVVVLHLYCCECHPGTGETLTCVGDARGAS